MAMRMDQITMRVATPHAAEPMATRIVPESMRVATRHRALMRVAMRRSILAPLRARQCTNARELAGLFDRSFIVSFPF